MALNLRNPLDILTQAIEEANTLGLQIQSATGNKDDQVKAVLATSDDPKIVKFREGKTKVEQQIETLQAQLTNATADVSQYASTLLPDFDPNFDVEASKKEFAKKRQEVTAARKALLMFVSEEDLDAALKEAGVSEVVSVKGTGGNKGQTGIRRARLSAATWNGDNVAKDDGSVDFTYLSKVSKVSSEDLKAAAYKAAGTDDLNSVGAGNVVSFEVGDNKFTVTISDKKPGRKPAAENTSDQK